MICDPCAEGGDVLVQLAPDLVGAVDMEGSSRPGSGVAVRIDTAVEDLTHREPVPPLEHADVTLAEGEVAVARDRRLADAVGIAEVLLPVRQPLAALFGDDSQPVPRRSTRADARSRHPTPHSWRRGSCRACGSRRCRSPLPTAEGSERPESPRAAARAAMPSRNAAGNESSSGAGTPRAASPV